MKDKTREEQREDCATNPMNNNLIPTITSSIRMSSN